MFNRKTVKVEKSILTVFYIISGSGILETYDGEQTITAGDIILCPAGKDGAHKITNTSKVENLVYLDVDTYQTPDINYYPNSNKIGIRDFENDVYDNYSIDSKIDYYENE